MFTKMDTLHILDMPDDCLLHIFHYMDMKTQCNFAFTCLRFRNIYEMVYRNKFYFYAWNSPVDDWSRQEIDEFFQLNGYKIRMLSVSDLHDKNFVMPLVTKAQYLVNICVHLKNVQSLMLSIDNNLNEVIIEICKHMQKLDNLVIDCPYHANFEYLILLPNLRSLDINHFVSPFDRLFQSLAEMRPNTMEHLRIGTNLTLEQGRGIAHLRSLTLLNINNPSIHFFNGVVLKLTNLRVLNITSGEHLRYVDFRYLIMHLKFLATLFVNKCTELSNDFILFLIQYFKVDVMLGNNVRRLPFHLEISATRVTQKVSEIETVKSSGALLNVIVKDGKRQM